MALDELKKSANKNAQPALVLIIALVTGSAVVVLGLNLLDARIVTVARADTAVQRALVDTKLETLVDGQKATDAKLNEILSKVNQLASDARVAAAVASAKAATTTATATTSKE